jgi:hypothetical protein
MLERLLLKETLSFLERLAEHSKRVRSKADALSFGHKRDVVLEEVKQAERAASPWLSSAEQETESPEELAAWK